MPRSRCARSTTLFTPTGPAPMRWRHIRSSSRKPLDVQLRTSISFKTLSRASRLGLRIIFWRIPSIISRTRSPCSTQSSSRTGSIGWGIDSTPPMSSPPNSIPTSPSICMMSPRAIPAKNYSCSMGGRPFRATASRSSSMRSTYCSASIPKSAGNGSCSRSAAISARSHFLTGNDCRAPGR